MNVQILSNETDKAVGEAATRIIVLVNLVIDIAAKIDAFIPKPAEKP